MAHIPVVRVRWVLLRAIQMARAGEVVVISVGGCVGVIRMEHSIGVIGMPGVGVIVEREIAMRVGVIAMVGVGVAMSVLMRRSIRMVAVWWRVIRVRDVAVHVSVVFVRLVGVRRRIRMRHVGVRRCICVRGVGMRSVSMVVVRAIGVRRRVRMRRVGVRRVLMRIVEVRECISMRRVSVVSVVVVRRDRRIQVDVQVLNDVVHMP